MFRPVRVSAQSLSLQLQKARHRVRTNVFVLQYATAATTRSPFPAGQDAVQASAGYIGGYINSKTLSVSLWVCYAFPGPLIPQRQ